MCKIVYKLVYDRKKRLNKNGTAVVQVETYLSGKKKYFSTGIYLKPVQWDKKSLVVKNHPNADALNRMIYEFIVMIEKKELELWQLGKRITLELLKEALAADENKMAFLPFFRQEVTSSLLRESTKRNHLTTLALLRKFDKDVTFADLDFEFITSFESFLQSRGYQINTIAKHMKHLKRYINIAINKNYMDIRKYPFRKYKIKTVESKRTHLTPEELGVLENLRLPGKYAHHRKTLDAFLFCCYAGMRYSDFVSLTPDNIVALQQETWLLYTSVKTGTEVRLPLYLLFEGKGIALLEKYRNDLPGFFHLEHNSNVNKVLAIITRLAGLSKKVSFHTARHTNATLLIYDGVNITTIQKLLGHKNVRTTQIYTSVMDLTIVHDLKRNHL